MNKKAKKILNIISTVIVVLAVILAIMLAGVRLFGLKPYAVRSGSMSPVYHTGDLIYVKDVDTDKLKVGDIITYAADEDTVVTHRIVDIEIREDEPDVRRFVTKGDANDTNDGSAVHQANVIGKPVASVPFVGYLSYVITTPPYTYISIAVGAVLLFLVFLPDLLFESEAKKKKKDKEQKGADDKATEIIEDK